MKNLYYIFSGKVNYKSLAQLKEMDAWQVYITEKTQSIKILKKNIEKTNQQIERLELELKETKLSNKNNSSAEKEIRLKIKFLLSNIKEYKRNIKKEEKETIKFVNKYSTCIKLMAHSLINAEIVEEIKEHIMPKLEGVEKELLRKIQSSLEKITVEKVQKTKASNLKKAYSEIIEYFQSLHTNKILFNQLEFSKAITYLKNSLILWNTDKIEFDKFIHDLVYNLALVAKLEITFTLKLQRYLMKLFHYKEMYNFLSASEIQKLKHQIIMNIVKS